MNDYVIKFQMMAFLTLVSPDPHIPRIDLNVLRLQFELLNAKLRSYVEPVVLYLNAIRQVGNGLATFQSGIEKEENKIVIQKPGEMDLSFHLFQTDQCLFDQFAIQLNHLRAHQSELNTLSRLELEDEAFQEEKVSLPANEEKDSCVMNDSKEKLVTEKHEDLSKEEELSCMLQEAFLPCNTRRIMRNLKDLFKELGKEESYVLKWGKGDHRKLYIKWGAYCIA
jgi:hypothetical protein